MGRLDILYIWRMDQNQLFTLALGLSTPWKIVAVEFSSQTKRLVIQIDFAPGSKFPLGGDSKDMVAYPAFDTEWKEWRHLDFFQHECYLKARTPRVKLPDGSIKTVTPPWAGRERGFTLLFEALLLQLLKCMPFKQVENLCRVSDDKLWRMVKRYVADARELVDMSLLTVLGVDETSIKKGHDYVTLFVDVEKSKTLYVTPGKGSETFTAFHGQLVERGGEAAQVSVITMDMSPAFIKGADHVFPQAQKVFDKFHIVKLFNAAIDKVRRSEQQELGKDNGKVLKNSRWLLMKNRSNLTEKQRVSLASIEMQAGNLKTFKLLRMRESLQEAYAVAKSQKHFETLLKGLRQWLLKSRIEAAVELGRMMKEHWLGITSWFKLRYTNAILEGLNSLVKAAAARARGYRTFENYATIIYLITGKLDFKTLNSAIAAT
jgi:transposase